MLQRVVAGVGNVYKSEVLFFERVAPETPVAALTDDALLAIVRRARALLLANVGRTNRVTRSTLRGTSPYWVYGRRGKPCFRCRTPIAMILQGASAQADVAWRVPPRSTYHCPSCQARTR